MKQLTTKYFIIILTITATLLYSGNSIGQTLDTAFVSGLFSMSLEDMQNIKITSASHFTEIAKETPVTTIVITQEDIKTYGYMSLNEIIENVPGFYAIDDLSYNGLIPGVRGFWSGNSRNVIIMVNGVRRMDLYSSGYRLRDNPIPVETIDRIEIVRGPLSVIYGSGAFYGVINIITNESDRSVLAASYGTNKTNRVVTSLASAHSKKIKFSFTAYNEYTHGKNIPLGKMSTNVPLDIPDNTDGRLENRNTYFNFSTEFEDFNFGVTYFENPREIYFIFPSASSGYLNQQSGFQIYAGYRKEINNKISINSNLVYNRQFLRAEADYFNKEYYGKENIETEGAELNANLLYAISKKISLSTGINSRVIMDIYDPFDHPRLLGNTYVPGVSNTIIRLDDGSKIITLSAYAQVSYSPISKLNLVAGLGFDNNFGYDILRINGGGSVDPADYSEIRGEYKQEKVSVYPRLAAIYNINNNHTLKFLYGEAINSPSFQQNWTQIVFDAYGSTLEPERIRTLELNYLALPVNFLSVNISLFRNYLDQLITRTHDFDADGNYFTYNSNAGKMITNGVEILANLTPMKNMRAEVSLTYQKTKNETEGIKDIDVGYSPTLLGYIKASYKVDRFTIGLTGNYVDEMETYWDISTPVGDDDYGARIGQKVSGYVNFSANINVDNIFNKGLYVSFKAYNLLNNDIMYPAFTNNRWADKGTIGYGRMLMLTAGWNFSL